MGKKTNDFDWSMYKEPKKKEKVIVVKGPDEPMTKAQKHIIVNKRSVAYGAQVLKDYITKKYGIENPDLQKLTKLQAQDLIVSFKPDPAKQKKLEEREIWKAEQRKKMLELRAKQDAYEAELRAEMEQEERENKNK